MINAVLRHAPDAKVAPKGCCGQNMRTLESNASLTENAKNALRQA